MKRMMCLIILAFCFGGCPQGNQPKGQSEGVKIYTGKPSEFTQTPPQPSPEA